MGYGGRGECMGSIDSMWLADLFQVLTGSRCAQVRRSGQLVGVGTRIHGVFVRLAVG